MNRIKTDANSGDIQQFGDLKDLAYQIMEVCQAFHGSRRETGAFNNETPDKVIPRRGKYSELEVMSMMEMMSDANILNYGVSLRTAWVEDRDQWRPFCRHAVLNTDECCAACGKFKGN